MDVRNYLIQHDMVCAGDLVIVAVSGGADSVCLLLVLQELQRELGYELEAVHVEHGIRGEASRRDARFTEELCCKKKIALHTYPVDVPGYAARHGGGLEETARKLRYASFARLVQEKMQEGYAPEQIRIALAHHMQDQAETVLFRLARGTGMAGLAGMEPVRRDAQGYSYIRPLLGTTRDEVEAYLARRGQAYCTDATNQEDDYARNRIRVRVLPELSKVNAQAARHIAQTAELAAEQQDYIGTVAKQELERIAKRKTDAARPAWSAEQKAGQSGAQEAAWSAGLEDVQGGAQEAAWSAEQGVGQNGLDDRISLNIDELVQLHPALQREILRQALCEVAGYRKDLTSGHVQQLMELAKKTSGSHISLPYDVEAEREFSWLVIYRRRLCSGENQQNCSSGSTSRQEPAAAGKGEIVVSPEQIAQWKESGEKVYLRLSASEMLTIGSNSESLTISRNLSDFRKKTYTKSFNYDMIKDGFTIRRRQPGDYFYMKNGHRKKLKKYLIEAKIPASRRQELWLVASGSQVLWVIGE